MDQSDSKAHIPNNCAPSFSLCGRQKSSKMKPMNNINDRYKEV